LSQLWKEGRKEGNSDSDEVEGPIGIVRLDRVVVGGMGGYMVKVILSVSAWMCNFGHWDPEDDDDVEDVI
jgi:hypothetical protein